MLTVPHAIAISDAGQEMTYAELYQQVNQLARQLRFYFDTQEPVIAIGISRSTEFVIAMLAVLKAGAAFVALDISQPQERLLTIVTDAKVNILLTRDDTLNCFSKDIKHILVVSNTPSSVTQVKNSADYAVFPEQLAYIIYTSGFTRTPKEVMITHANITTAY